MARRPRTGLLPPDKAIIQYVLVKASHATRDGMKWLMGEHLGAVAAHGLGMHNPKMGIDCHPDPECPTCRRERRR
jgi:hypothetical protein